MQLTEHYADSELGVVGCEERLIANAEFLCMSVLEGIHAKFGTTRVHDGHRDPGHNARVGGKKASYHLFEDGKAAADVSASAVSDDVLFDWLRLESELPFDKVILEMDDAGVAQCVHVQVDRFNAPRREAYTGHTGAGKVYLPVQVK
jgi:hypothetical protein